MAECSSSSSVGICAVSGPLPKSPDRRQRRNSHLVPFRNQVPLTVPPMPAGLLVSTQSLWTSFFSSALARAIEPESDLPAITRYFSLLDERERLYRAFKRKRIVKGSQGQPMLNPAGRALHGFDAELRQLEDRLGLTPRARLQLGIQLTEAARSLAELNQALDEDEDDEPRA
jgi:P27 family predicted phage terminase small subunit